MERGAWRAVAAGVAKSQTRLSNLAHLQGVLGCHQTGSSRKASAETPPARDMPLYHPSIKEGPSFLSTDGPRPLLPCTVRKL